MLINNRSFFINFKQPFCHDLSQLLLRFHDGSTPCLGRTEADSNSSFSYF
jgi:hypothetical protein